MRNGFPKWLTHLGIAAIVLLPIWMLQLSFQHQAPPPAKNEVIIRQEKTVKIQDAVKTLNQAEKKDKNPRKSNIPPLRSTSVPTTYESSQAVVRNVAKGKNSLVSGGKANVAQGDHTTVGGGQENLASKWESTVAGGSGNQATEIGATVSGGKDNVASGILSSVGGGRFNRATGVISRVSGGANNQARAMGTWIGGGKENQAGGNFSAVSGGEANVVSGFYGVVSGGIGNSASGRGDTISGGESNVTIDVYTTIGGGIMNFARGYAATIAGGAGNGVLGDQSAVGGGWNNIAFGHYSTIPGGEENVTRAPHTFAAGRKAHALHDGAYVWADSTGETMKSTGKDQFSARASGGFRLSSSADGASGVELPPGSGSWSSLSSREAKENFAPINGQNILQAIAGLELATWTYQSESPDIRHLGPVAEDFHEAFGLGDSPRRISTVDADGVALAGIQALYQELQILKKEMEKLQNENHHLREALQNGTR